MSLIYLACPYWHDDPKVRAKRAWAAAGVTHRLIHRGVTLFSPICHGHLVNLAEPSEPITHPTWMRLDMRILAHCEELWILGSANVHSVLHGAWTRSRGVEEEFRFAHRVGMPIALVDAESLARDQSLTGLPEHWLEGK